ncbi:MAG: hypothetical protein MUF64_02800 [Polyangiaceae bacterium]|jgi:tetratricopeptide (TPR) repeat protein|nr:hypothetical protein [Polyangiaceae bacterium]
MSDLRLLKADEEQLARVARWLASESAFVLIQCAPALRPLAIDHLRRGVPGLHEPVEMTDGRAMLGALLAQSQQHERRLCFSLPPHPEGVLEALNWHREKLLRGAPVALWLRDEDEVRTLRHVAPDAFSFRSGMVALQGAVTPSAIPAGESEALALARRQHKKAKTRQDKARAQLNLAEALWMVGRDEEAVLEVQKGLQITAYAADDALSRIEILLLRLLGILRKQQGRFGSAEQVLEQANELTWRLPVTQSNPLKIHLATASPGPYGVNRRRLAEASELAQRYGIAPEDRALIELRLAEFFIHAGDLKQAAPLIERPKTYRVHQAFNESIFMDVKTEWLRQAGRLREALAEGERALGLLGGAEDGSSLGYTQALCWIDAGEIDQARLVARHWHLWLTLACEALQGKPPQELVGAILNDDIRSDTSGAPLYLQLFADHPAFETDERLQARVIQGVEDAWLAYQKQEGEKPAWFHVRFLGYRALARSAPAWRKEGIALARQGLELARAEHDELVAEAGRVLADLLLLDGEYAEALAAVVEGEAAASTGGYLKERCRLLANRLLAQVALEASAAEIEVSLEILRAVCKMTGSTRIEAEILRDLARRLPSQTRLPDRLALAEEAMTLFAAMPMPIEVSLCMEIQGDTLVHRGLFADALGRYQAAVTSMERRGVVPWLARLRAKMATATVGLPPRQHAHA